MNEGTLGEVKSSGNFAPRDWALCEGNLLPINNYQSLYSVLGTAYGGDGRTTFGLPKLANLPGKMAVRCATSSAYAAFTLPATNGLAPPTSQRRVCKSRSAG